MPCSGNFIYHYSMYPWHAMTAVIHLLRIMHAITRRGGIIVIYQNILNKYLVEMCGSVYTPTAVTDKSKRLPREIGVAGDGSQEGYL